MLVWKRHWVLRNLGARHGDGGDEERDDGGHGQVLGSVGRPGATMYEMEEGVGTG